MKLYWLTLIAYGLVSSKVVMADDTEIYRNTDNRINPNVIFLIDTSGSMAYEAADNSQPEAGELSRLDIVKKSATDAISQLSTNEPINIAVMRFDDLYNGSYEGGFVLEPFVTTNTDANKTILKNAINSLIAPGGTKTSNMGGGTPMTESFMEAARYMLGMKADYGKYQDITYKQIGTKYTSSGGVSYFGTDKKGRGSDPDSMELKSGTYYYKSPITATCQKNHIVIFTDGAPSSDSSSDEDIRNLLTDNSISLPKDTVNNSLSSDCKASSSGSCAEELAYFLQNHDHFKDSDITGTVDPNASEVTQSVYVHTVGGFSGIDDFGKKLLNDVAKYGHPLTPAHLNADGTSKHYYAASDEAQLTDALLKVFGGIANTAGNFAAPVVAVNAFNSLEHRDELYYSVFQPSESPGWSGNIKRYRMNSSGTILDVNDVAAIDPQTGFFKDDSKSFWTIGDPDGAIVANGGIAKRMPSDRKVYTLLSGLGNIISSSNKVDENNSSITKAMLDDFLPTGTTLTTSGRTAALKWAHGMDPSTGAAHYELPDPLHGNPVLMTYGESTSSTSDVLFTGTNAGYIHAFNPDKDAPSELWAFVPKEMLPNIPVYQQGLSRLVKAYGIDGPLSVYHADSNSDRIINSGETAYLAVGMRRGGSHYYLLDISDKNAPKLKAQISSGNTGFEELGQTWSRMIPATVTWNGKKTDVFFFGGGYDTDEDNASTRITHDKGNAIYMVRASADGSGKPFDLLWKASGNSGNAFGPYLSSMKSSFAGDLSLVDNDGNGTVDLIYAADVGGRLWRFDIDKDNSSASTFATGGAIADFNDGTKSGDVRFYTQPDVVYTESGSFTFQDAANPSNTYTKSVGRYQITIGSGFRAGPLSTAVKDKIFVLNDFNINAAPTTYKAIGVSDLANYASYDSATADQQLNGFYYPLPYTGEKVLSTTLTVNDVIYIPTFRPSDSSIEIGCEPDTGQARLIIINMKDPKKVVITKELEQGGIVPKPILVFPPSDPTTGEPSKPVIAIGTEVTQVEGDFNALQQTYWRPAQ
ncbi:PilC/PilY family type IV pilus protein [Thalassolituus sp. LLYu03]|uniref:PilC/PilY family type IV pilus protein n=1 Tax=Thalassolituus sp. LLYu03 TaxID=3421656 RepID=UPI003D28061A